MSRKLLFRSAEIITGRLERRFAKTLQTAYEDSYKEITKLLSLANMQYGDLSNDTLNQRATIKGRSVTRLIKLEYQLKTEINKLNRGQPQRFASFLTDSYLMNRNEITKTIDNVSPIKVNFQILDRKKIYESAIQPMGKISLKMNEQATWLNIQRAMTQSITQGEGVRDMATRIQMALRQNGNNALVIARTENTRVSNKARLDTFEEAEKKGIKLGKIWIATGDDRTRDRHIDINGEIKSVDKPFSNGLMCPGDQTGGDASETVNCRCAMGAILL